MHVTLVALPHCLPSSLTLPLEMLGAAEGAARRRRGGRGLTVTLAGPRRSPRVPTLGITLQPERCWEDIGHTDLVLLPALWRNPLQALRRQADLYPWLLDQANAGSMLCAVGTGSFLLAECGLLAGRPATTHWFYFDLFERRYPAVELKRQHLITAADNRYCAGSVNSVADLTIHFIEHFHGRAVARHVEAQFSPEIRRPFEQHVYVQGRDNRHGDELVAQAQDWLRRSAGGSATIAALARQLGVSLRTLDRRFRQATGMTPRQYQVEQRLAGARELLRTTDLGVGEIAALIGYQDTAHFCRRFRERMGHSPGAYRDAVRGKLFSVRTDEATPESRRL